MSKPHKAESKGMNGPWGVVITLVLISIMPAVVVYQLFKGAAGQTKEKFSADYSCPADSISLVKRPDVHAEQFERPAAPPPPDVAADPARLEVWKSNQPKPWSVEFFELSGCGHHVLWGCRLPSSKSSAGVHAFCPYTRDL